ncbi:MAG: 4Fe-4S binding protein [Chloroflexi bacterium]|nr:4Fe-4S binding protein [Chloroflexota bacterium]
MRKFDFIEWVILVCLFNCGGIKMSFQRTIQQTQTKFIRLSANRCKGCWKCIEACPKQVLGKIRKGPHRRVQIEISDNCTGCKKCVNVCKYDALEYLIIPKTKGDGRTFDVNADGTIMFRL